MGNGFLMTTRREGPVSYVSCAGELDVATAIKLSDALDLVLDSRTRSLRFDGCGITLLTAAGIRVLFELSERAKNEGFELDLLLSTHCRRILDRVGLWWLGVLEDGPAAERELDSALKMFAELPPEKRVGWAGPTMDVDDGTNEL